MENVLSQEEIDALLGGLSDGQIEAGGEESPEIKETTEATPFDFNDQDRFVRGRLPTLETIHDRFARLLRLSLSTTLRRGVEIQVCSQTLCTFGDFSQSLERPSSLHLINMSPLKGHGLLVLPARLILTLVDLMFGGDGKAFVIEEERDFTLIEERVILKVAEDIFHCYTESWAPVFPIEISEAGRETNVQFINIAQPSDTVNVVDCDVMIDGAQSALSFCIPYTMIEPLKETLKGAFVGDTQDTDKIWTQRLTQNLKKAPVEINGKLGTTNITGRELLNLKRGDIIQLEQDFEHPVEILVEGICKFWGIAGIHKSTKALQISAVEPMQGKN
jgi:flagellar motor switch protein FliM